MKVVRLSVSMYHWLQAGNTPDEGTHYVCVECWNGNVHPYRATLYKGAVYVGRTGSCKTAERAASAAYKMLGV